MGDGMDSTRQRIFGDCIQSDVGYLNYYTSGLKGNGGVVNWDMFLVLSIYSACDAAMRFCFYTVTVTVSQGKILYFLFH